MSSYLSATFMNCISSKSNRNQEISWKKVQRATKNFIYANLQGLATIIACAQSHNDLDILIHQTSSEAHFVQGFLEHVQSVYHQKYDQASGWEHHLVLGSPDSTSRQAWLYGSALIYIRNIHTRLSQGRIDTIVDFSRSGFIHPDLAGSRVVFYAIDGEQNPISLKSTFSAKQPTELVSWACSLHLHQDNKSRRFGFYHGLEQQPLKFTSLLPYPFSLCTHT